MIGRFRKLHCWVDQFEGEHISIQSGGTAPCAKTCSANAFSIALPATLRATEGIPNCSLAPQEGRGGCCPCLGPALQPAPMYLLQAALPSKPLKSSPTSFEHGAYESPRLWKSACPDLWGARGGRYHETACLFSADPALTKPRASHATGAQARRSELLPAAMASSHSSLPTTSVSRAARGRPVSGFT